MDEQRRQQIKALFDQMQANNDRAVEIASRSPFQDKTPEEQAFEEKNLDPFTRGIIGGGVMGSVERAGATAAKALFPKLKSMFQVGDKVFPASSTAEAMKVRKALGLDNKIIQKLD